MPDQKRGKARGEECNLFGLTHFNQKGTGKRLQVCARTYFLVVAILAFL
jgi:hypothetical protein